MTKTKAANILEFTSEQGTKFTLQKVKPSKWLAILDEVASNQGKGNTILYVQILENIVVSPKMEVDDFENFSELEEVIKEATRFQRGK